ncbi:MAG: L-aspartate oxidase [Lachnospiraceae bacterium]|nr:L-aspartate oxidase [Lachnospiraceae bacterium]
MKADILIVGSGCSGLYAALHLPADKEILLITKSDFESSDSFLAQGGICMLRDNDDYDSYFEDTMKAGHYENDKTSVDIMIRSSQDTIKALISYGVDFHRDDNGELDFTREGAHSRKRILFHEDITGKEITSHLLAEAKKRSNITLMEYTTLLDIIEENNICYGAIIRTKDGKLDRVDCDYTIFATGGIGGLYKHSTNFRHLTGDALAIAIKHNIELKDINYVQIHPTTFFNKDENERSFLISESVRGEGAHLYGKNMERFTNELLPRDLLTKEIKKQMAKDHTEHVWEDFRTIPYDELHSHFPNIIAHCLEHGVDPDKECVPVTPAQHYFMGGIKVDHQSKTTMDHLYAVGETACNGVHGRNRLASNSLLESMVFAKRAAKEISATYEKLTTPSNLGYINVEMYKNRESIANDYKELVLDEIKNA